MKKFLVSVAVALCASAACLAACAPDVGGYPSRAVREQIESAYAETLGEGEEACIAAFLGEYRGTYVVEFADADGIVEDVIYHEKAGDVVITCPQPTVFRAYRGGRLYTLQQAFDEGFLTNAELDAVKNCYRERSVGVTEEQALAIKRAFLESAGEEGGGYTVGDISLRVNSKLRNGAVVTFIDGIYEYTMAIEHRFIDGVEFVYGSGQTLSVFYGGELYSLETAYERGIVSRDELVRISGRQNHGY